MIRTSAIACLHLSGSSEALCVNLHRLLVHLIHVLDVGLQHRTMNMRQDDMFLVSCVNAYVEVIILGVHGCTWAGHGWVT